MKFDYRPQGRRNPGLVWAAKLSKLNKSLEVHVLQVELYVGQLCYSYN